MFKAYSLLHHDADKYQKLKKQDYLCKYHGKDFVSETFGVFQVVCISVCVNLAELSDTIEWFCLTFGRRIHKEEVCQCVCVNLAEVSDTIEWFCLTFVRWMHKEEVYQCVCQSCKTL